ncbi:MAG: hypothetical protein Q4F34_04930 [Prevotellaceae bacterium]|nr:hypothetical protein [Prevotellaceae bacterium]
MEEDLAVQLRELQKLFADAAPDDRRVVEEYAWTICKVLNRESEKLSPLYCRQLLAEYMKLDVVKPSLLHSAMLNAAVKVAVASAEFHFVPFLNLWNLSNLRREDYERQKDDSGKAFPSLVEKVGKAYVTARLMRPQETLADSTEMERIVNGMGFHIAVPMVVTKVSEFETNGRKLKFASLVGIDGKEANCEVHALRVNPALPKTGNQHHFVNVGQMYDVILKDKKDGESSNVYCGILSQRKINEVFPCETGYVEHVDPEHRHTHVYDAKSRHFVSATYHATASPGQFVDFVPVIPEKNKFKSAIIYKVYAKGSGAAEFGIRELKVTFVNHDKGYIAWELADVSAPIVEAGTSGPSFTSGYVSVDMFMEQGKNVPAVGESFRAIVFLKRGKDLEKRPHVAMVVD